MLAIHLHDAELGRIFHRDPLLRHSMERLPGSCSNELFAAPDDIVWKSLMMKEQSHNLPVYCSPALPTPPSTGWPSPSYPDVTSDFGLCAMLETIAALASDNREAAVARSHTSLRCRELLLSWLVKYKRHPLYEQRKPSLMTLWHSIFMCLHADFDALECACGREAYTVSVQYRPVAEAWVKSVDAKRCLLHSVLVQKHIERLPMGTQPPIHAPLSLYYCGLVWFCYTQFRGGEESLRDWQGRLDFPEMQLLGVDAEKIFREEVEPGLGKRSSSPLLKIIDLLQRMTHWKLAHHLASTLLALIEGRQGSFV